VTELIVTGLEIVPELGQVQTILKVPELLLIDYTNPLLHVQGEFQPAASRLELLFVIEQLEAVTQVHNPLDAK